MPWVYSQRTGALYRPDGSCATNGYSGFLMGRNNPNFQNAASYGPIPTGLYTIGFPHGEPKKKKMFVMDLTPLITTSDRSGFQIHGDSTDHPGFASDGCIVVGPAVRLEIATSRDRLLQVRSW